MLRKNEFRTQIFEDVSVEKEIRIREKISKMYEIRVFLIVICSYHFWKLIYSYEYQYENYSFIYCFPLFFILGYQKIQ